MNRKIVAIALAVFFGGALLYGAVVQDPPLPAFGQSHDDIPVWIKATAGFWIDDTITDDEFLQAISYLIEEGVIRNEPYEALKSEHDVAQMELESIRPLAAVMVSTVISSELTHTTIKNICSMPLEDVVDTLTDDESSYSPELVSLVLDLICDTDQAAGDPYTVEIVRCANTASGYVETKGFITNHEDVARTYTVTFTLLDAAGKPITFENGYAFDVPPGTERPVEAIFFEDVQFDSCRATVAVR